jgi:type IV secretion system protein VirB9
LASSANGALFKTGQSYALIARPGYLTTVMLAPGEKIISRASGDTARWMLGETVEGVGETARPIVLLRPRKPGLRTNIVLATDHRTYLLEVKSEETRKFTSVFSWSYGETIRSSSRSVDTSNAGLDSKVLQPAAMTLPFTHLNMAYRVVPASRSHAPSWRPKRVFDDGSRTYIEFPTRLPQYIAPPLFSIDISDKLELLNYHVIKNYYIVDRILDRAKLVYGEKGQDVVTIDRVKEND